MGETAPAILRERQAASSSRSHVLRDAPNATPYDFRGAVHLSPDQLRGLAQRAGGLASIVSRTLQAYLDADVSFSLHSLATVSHEQFISSLPDGLIAGVVAFSSGLPSGLWEVPASIASAAVDCMLGGRGTTLPDIPRDLTPVQAAVVSRFISDIIAAWSTAWDELAALSPRIERIVTNAAVAAGTGRVDAQMVHLRFNVHIAAAEGVINVGLPITVMQRLLQELRGDDRLRRESAREQLGQASLGEHARRCACVVRVILPGPPITLRRLLTLQPGDTLDLQCPPDEPFVVVVGDGEKFAATPGTSRGLVAARIETTLAA